jgi:hypothetical protein
MQVAHMGDIFPISTIIGCYIPEIPKNDLKIRDQQLYFLKRNIQATEMRWAEANFMRTEGNMMVMELGGGGIRKIGVLRIVMV